MREQLHRTETDYNYKGRSIHASVGLHETSMEKINEDEMSDTKHILELGCGSGAFSQRLLDHGYFTTSVDLNLDNFSVETEALEVDLNTTFVDRLNHHQYDWIVALEVLEHLENPLNFLRQIKVLMNPNSKFLISFPNIYLYFALRSFFNDGTFVNWNINQYWETGHQTIVTDWLFEQHLKKIDLQLEKKYFVASLDLETWIPKTWKRWIHYMFLWVICRMNSKITKEMRMADNVIFIGKKSVFQNEY